MCLFSRGFQERESDFDKDADEDEVEETGDIGTDEGYTPTSDSEETVETEGVDKADRV